MTSLTQFHNSDCEASLSERITGALFVMFFGAVFALNTASVVLALLAA